MTMEFDLKQKDWTDEAASLWGDILELDRPATFAEARHSFHEDDLMVLIENYFDPDGKYQGPCELGISIIGHD